MMLDRPLRERRDENRADAAAGEYQRKSETSVLVKPGEHSARIRKLCRTVGDQSQHKKCEIELPYVWSKPAERSERQREDEDRRQDDTPRWKAIEQEPDAWRNQGYGNRRECEGAADGFALPAKRRMQGIQEEAKGVRNDRSKTHHHACKGGSDHPPPSVVKGALVRCFLSGCSHDRSEGGARSSHARTLKVPRAGGAIFAECQHIHIAHKVEIYLTPEA
jgi:hypothetical protein